MYYDLEVLSELNNLKNGDSVCISLITGGGKSQSIMEFVKRNSTKSHLLIFSTTKEQETFLEELGEDMCMCWNSELKVSFKHAIDKFENGAFCITKQKFINLIVNDELDILNRFDYIFYDEFASLNPCLVDDLVSKLSEVQKCSRNVFSNLDRKLYDGLDFIYRDINLRTFNTISIENSEDKLFNRIFKLECNDKYINIATEILENLKVSKDEVVKTKLKLKPEIKLMLHSIKNNKLYVSAYRNKDEIVYNILGVNDMIKDFISQYSGRFIVMDATAKLVSDVYSYLGIRIIDDFTKNKNKTYEHVEIKIHDIEGVKASDIRQGKKEYDESKKGVDNTFLDSVSKIIKSRKVVTFVPKKIKETFQAMYGYDFEKVYYFFSGFDIGSNKFVNETELNIIALQTYPKAQRVLYNHIIKGIDLEIANFSRDDKAEQELLSSLLVQNINRSKSRVYDSTDKITINLICVSETIAQKAKEFMKGSKMTYATKIYHKEFNNNDRIFNCLDEYLKSYLEEKIVIELDNFLINRGFYDNLTEMLYFIDKNKKEIMGIALRYGFYLKIEDGRPHLIKIENKYTEEEFLSLYSTKDKVFVKITQLKQELYEISIKDLKFKLNISTPTFSRIWKKHEKDFEGFGIYRVGNSIIFRKNGYDKK